MTIQELKERLAEYYRPSRPQRVFVSLTLLEYPLSDVTDHLLEQYTSGTLEEYYPLMVCLRKYQPKQPDRAPQDKAQLLALFPGMKFKSEGLGYVEGIQGPWEAGFQSHSDGRRLEVTLMKTPDRMVVLYASNDSWELLARNIRDQLVDLRGKCEETIKYLDGACE